MDFIERTPFFWSTGGFVTLSLFALGIFAIIAIGVLPYKGGDVSEAQGEELAGVIVLGAALTLIAAGVSFGVTHSIHTGNQRDQVVEQLSERYGAAMDRYEVGKLGYPKKPVVGDQVFDNWKMTFITGDSVEKRDVTLIHSDGKFKLVATDGSGEIPLKGMPKGTDKQEGE